MFNNRLLNHIAKYQLIILVGIFVALAGLLTYSLVFGLVYQPAMEKIGNNLTDNIPLPGTKFINGEKTVINEENLWPVAVAIDNHPDARPLYGLSKADVVYEFLVEGGATRFLALYTPGQAEENSAEKIGPVRSVRPYFLLIVKEYNALLAHAGGSAEALNQIEKLAINNLEEIAWWGPEYFWRVYSRSAPHNLFTSSKNLRKATEEWKLKELTPSYRTWRFGEELNNNYRLNRAEKITIDFSSNTSYRAEFIYSTSTRSYERWQEGKADYDALNEQAIRADNVIIQFVPAEKILDEVGRLALETTGEGESWLMRDGVKIEGHWRKGSAEGRTIFYDQAGEELPLKPGRIWIEIVPKGKGVEIEETID
ncbi:DUF3048 domain-containing protein [Candidatus Kuenenbacteria bacterium]|nr:DUF3048 domain-containing protein [Candidatus Kuenenbacteria bacterium]